MVNHVTPTSTNLEVYANKLFLTVVPFQLTFSSLYLSIPPLLQISCSLASGSFIPERSSTGLHQTAHMEVPRATPATRSTRTSRKRSLQDKTSPPQKRAKVPAVAVGTPSLKTGGRGAKSSAPAPCLNAVPTSRLEVFVFGDGSAGELGLGNTDAIEVKRPRLNHNLDPKSVGVVSLAAGGMHAAALTHDNKILTWGVNDLSALGRDTSWEGRMRDIDGANDSDSDESEPDLNPRESNPTAIPADKFPVGTRFVQVAAGDSATFGLTDDGLVYGWGTFRVSLAFIQIHLT
jgi:regulator of chromosome condensation